MRVMLDGLHSVTKKLAGGRRKVYHYAWRGGPRILADPNTPAFVLEFQQHVQDRDAPSIGTVSRLIHDYESSGDFERLGKYQKRDHRAMFKWIRLAFGDMPIEALQDRGCRRDFKDWRDTIKSNRQADRAWATLKRVFSVAKDNGVIDWNPCEGGGKRYKDDRKEFLWTDAQIAQFRLSAPGHLVLPVVIALHTGQRQGDILALKWSNYDGTRIRLTQSKTKRKVSILVTPELKALLDKMDRKSVFICTNSKGLPWKSGFQASFGKARRRASVIGVTFHDLRGTFITRRRNEGSSIEDIAEVAGVSLIVAERHYLAADEGRADGVILRMNKNSA
ncbi:MAG: tyrosine-type recombinase/integrase [Pseudomonadota bacterium]